MDSLEFEPLYEKMAKYDLPIWIHPFFQSTDTVSKKGEQLARYRVFARELEQASAMDRAAFAITSGTITAITLEKSGLSGNQQWQT